MPTSIQDKLAVLAPKEQSHPVALWLPEEYKSADFNRKKGIVTAYLTIYNNPDGTPFIDPYQDIVVPGSFTKTIQSLESFRKSRNNPWLCPDLWQHNREELIGSVVGLTEDSKGVIYETQFLLSIRRAQEAFDLAEAKMLGSSYGYDPIRSEPKNGVRYLQEIKLREVSQVTFPANDIAPILETKDAPQKFFVPDLPQQKNKSATDFTQIWNQRGKFAQLDVLYSMSGAMMTALTATIDDKNISDSDQTSAIDTILSQFSDAIKSWLPNYQQADDSSPDDSGMSGFFMSSELSTTELKNIFSSLKSGRVLSARNRQRLEESLATMRTQMESLQALLDDASPDQDDPDEKDITQAFMVLKGISVSPPTPQTGTPDQSAPPQQPPAPVSFPLLPPGDDVKLITDLLASIKGVTHNAPYNPGIPAIFANRPPD